MWTNTFSRKSIHWDGENALLEQEKDQTNKNEWKERKSSCCGNSPGKSHKQFCQYSEPKSDPVLLALGRVSHNQRPNGGKYVDFKEQFKAHKSKGKRPKSSAGGPMSVASSKKKPAPSHKSQLQLKTGSTKGKPPMHEIVNISSQKDGKAPSVSMGGVLTPSSTTVATKPTKEQLKKLAVNLNRVIQHA